MLELEHEMTDLVAAGKRAEQHGDFDEALSQYLHGLEHARAHGDTARAMKLLLALGRVYFERGDSVTSNQRFLECLVQARAVGDTRESAAALNGMAIVAQFRGELDVAEPLYMQAEQLARLTGDDRLCAMIAQNLGTLANTRGDMPTALLRYQTALDRFHALQDDRATAWVFNNMGMLHFDVGELSEAELCYASAYALAEREADHATLGKIDVNRAELHIKRQNYEFAREYCDRAFETFSRLASHTGLGEVHRCYGMLHRDTGRLQVAHVQLALALELARRCDNPLLEAEAESERARVFLAEKNYRAAIVALNRAYIVFCELDARREILDLRRRLDRMQEPFVHAIQMWTQEQMRWARPSQRGRRVSEFAVALAQSAGVQDVTSIRIAAYLLDVGSAALPRELLDRPGPLAADEREFVQTHAIAGETILNAVGFAPDIIRIVRQHHERWDGSGYPDGLVGTDISLGARIVSIADFVDALTSPRSFRTSINPAAALVMLKAESGKAFDPALCTQFLNLEVVRDLAHTPIKQAVIAELVP